MTRLVDNDVLWVSVQKHKKSQAAEYRDISAARLSSGDPWDFRPILANGLVLSLSTIAYMLH